jgi:hypothetical protein
MPTLPDLQRGLPTDDEEGRSAGPRHGQSHADPNPSADPNPDPNANPNPNPNPNPNRSAACALWNGLYSVGSVVGPLASASLYAHIGWLATMQLISLLCAALAAALALVAFLGDRWFGGGVTPHGNPYNAVSGAR